MLTDPVAVAISMARVLEACGLRYLVGGSLASSMSGEPRSTLDVDVVVALGAADVAPLVTGLVPEFDVDERAVARAVRDRSSVNVFHHASAIKVDIFVMGGSPLDEEQMNRRQRIQVTTDPDQYLYAYTPEDILLQKLLWFRKGNEVPDRQWRDGWAYCSCRVTPLTGPTSAIEPSNVASPISSHGPKLLSPQSRRAAVLPGPRTGTRHPPMGTLRHPYAPQAP